MLYMKGNAIVSNGFRWKGSSLMGKCLPRNGAKKYYTPLPTVYAIPPANSQNRPHVGTRSHNGFTAIRMSQPMARYRQVESFGYRTPPAAVSTTPARPKPHTSPNSVQPHVPRSTPRVNGVYVPAIMRKIAAWSRT